MPHTQIEFFVVGIALCLLGWLICVAGTKIVAVVLGSIIGFVTALFIAFLAGLSPKSHIVFLILFCVPVWMLIALYLMDRIQKLLFFLAGVSIGGMCAHLLKPMAINLGLLSEAQIIEVIFFHLFFAAIGGALAVKFSGYVICFITSSVGMFFITRSLQITSFHILIPIALISSFVFQCSTLRLLKKKKSD